ncbi:hypothetical protein ILYODFUR_034161 [Ilyodon furcidens]|uniref:Uncharacterized protein n=1 Tax=Ilyodon furcidens TaxID=33524 RepID=A0ABV0U1X7_9TELE
MFPLSFQHMFSHPVKQECFIFFFLRGREGNFVSMHVDKLASQFHSPLLVFFLPPHKNILVGELHGCGEFGGECNIFSPLSEHLQKTFWVFLTVLSVLVQFEMNCGQC